MINHDLEMFGQQIRSRLNAGNGRPDMNPVYDKATGYLEQARARGTLNGIAR